MQNRYLKGEEKNPKTREEMSEANGGIPLLIDLCLAMRSDPLGRIRGLGEVVTCVYGPALKYAFPGPLVIAYRHSVVHVNVISILDGTALNSCKQEDLRAQMSETVLFGKVKDPELIVLNFRGQLQCRMGGNEKVPSRPTRSFGLESSGKKHERGHEDPCMDEEFRVREKGSRNNCGAGRATRCDPRVRNGETDDIGNE